MKKIIIFLLLISTLTLMVQPIFAAQPVENDPQHENAVNAYVILSINSNGNACVNIVVTGKTSLKK